MSDTLTHRALRIEDAAATAELFMAMEQANPVDEAFNEQDFIEEFSGPRADLDRGSIGIYAGTRLVAAGWLLHKTGAPQGDSLNGGARNGGLAAWEYSVEGGVHPDFLGRGLGRRILHELAERAAQIRDADAPGMPGVLKVGVDELRPRSIALLTAAGFETWRYFLRMRRDLRAEVPAGAAPTTVAAVPATVLVRPYRSSDDDAVRLASNESWADHWGSTQMDRPTWRAQFAESASFRPAHSRVAVLAGAVVGFVLVSEFDADTEQRGYRTGYISRVGTVRPARGRSIASTLLADCLESLAAAGYRCAELDVDAESPTGAGPLYERAGFVTIGRMRVFGRRF